MGVAVQIVLSKLIWWTGKNNHLYGLSRLWVGADYGFDAKHKDAA